MLFVLVVAGINLTYMGMDLVQKTEFVDAEGDSEDREYDEHLPKSEMETPLSAHLILGSIFVLAVTTLATTITGSCLVHQLRKYYKENYYQHSTSIIWSIILVFFSTGALIAWNSIRISNQEEILNFEKNYRYNRQDSWKFPLLYLAMEVLGQYFPIALQLICLYVSIVGNWNELLQSQLALPDEDVTLKSDMLGSFM